MSKLSKVTIVRLDEIRNGLKRSGTLEIAQPQGNKQTSMMRTVNLSRVVNNTVISLIGQAVTWISTFSLMVAYGRFLGDVKFGELYFALTFVQLIGFPLEFGFNPQLTRDVAQEPDKVMRYLSNILLIKAFLWLALCGLLLLLSWLLGYSDEVRTLVAICAVILLSSSVTNTFASAHLAFERAVFPAVGSILEKGLSALCGVILLKYGVGVQVMALVLLGGSLANTIWQAIWFFRLSGSHFIVDTAFIRSLLYTSIPFIIYGVLGVIYYRIDTVLLSLQAGSAVVGWYGAAYRIFDTLIFLPSIVINAIMYPVFSKLSLNSVANLRVAIEKSLNMLLFMSIPIAAFLIAGAPTIIGFLYHNTEFIHTIPALQALAPGLVFLYINSVLSSVMISTKQEKKIPIMAGIALIFNLGLNIILIPRYQHVGAAIVTSLTEFLLFCLSLMLVPRHLLPLGSIRVGAKVLIASMVMILAIWLLSTFSIFVMLPIAMLVYVAVATLLGTIAREDMRALYSAVRNKARKTATVGSTDNEMQLDLQTTLEVVAVSSGALPAISAYQVFVDTQITLKQAAINKNRYLREYDADLEITEKRPRIKSVSLSSGNAEDRMPMRMVAGNFEENVQ